MPPVQTDYGTDFSPARAGLVVGFQVRSVQSQAAEGAIGAGRGVAKGTADDTCKHPAQASDVTAHFQGFAILDVGAKEPSGHTFGFEYADGDEVSILDEGEIWVAVDEAVAKDEQVFVRHTTALTGGSAGSDIGICRNDADTNKASAAPGCKFLSSTSGAGVALVKISGIAVQGATGATGATGPTGPTGPGA